MSQNGRDPVVRKNHIVSHYDILLSLSLKFEEQEGAGPPFHLYAERGGRVASAIKIGLSEVRDLSS
jgi:hypothetical protein